MSYLVGLKEATELTNKSHTTIQRAVKSGKLSCSLDENGNRQFDVAELHRVYPVEMPDEQRTHVRSQNSSNTHVRDVHEGSAVHVRDVRQNATESALLRQESELLRDQLTDVRKERDDWKQETERLRDDIDSWKDESNKWRKHADQNLHLLTDERSRHERHEQAEKEREEQGRVKASKLPQFAAIAALLVASAGVFTMLYPEEVREFAMLEMVPDMAIQPETVSIDETQQEIAAVPDVQVTHEPVIFPPLLLPAK